jgi:hypothetical protein
MPAWAATSASVTLGFFKTLWNPWGLQAFCIKGGV